MALKVARVPAYGVKVTNSLKGKVVGRAYLYVIVPAIRDLIRRRLSGGNGPLPPSAGGSSASAATPK